MLIDFWFENSRPNEQESTFKFLKEMGAEGVSVRLGNNGFEFTGRMYADTDEDIQKIVKVLLFYGDRSREELEKMIFMFPKKRLP